MRYTIATRTNLAGSFLRPLIISVISFLTLVDLFAAQAILPALAASYKVSPAAMAFAVDSHPFGMAAAGIPLPVCDYAGYAPFGFGYRRCPGEQLTVAVFSDFLRKVWADKIEFEILSEPNPAKIPFGPANIIDDNIGFRRGA